MRALVAAAVLAGCTASPSPPDAGRPAYHPCMPGADLPALAPVDVEAPLARARRLLDGAGLADVRVVLAEDAPGVAVDGRAGAFAATTTMIVGRDAAGALYGALEAVERTRAGAPRASFRGAPHVPLRAANLFIVLPAPSEARWWFHEEGFWREYLDMMMHARMNFLDLHGMYDPTTTIFPNAMLYFAASAGVPGVGCPRESREANLAWLNAIIAMARSRGIEVGLMSYRSDLQLLGHESEHDPRPLPVDDAAAQQFAREAAEDLARRAPGLARLGFRVGESGHAAGWYVDTFVAGVLAAGTGVRIATRTWWTDAQGIAQIVAAAGGDVIVETKYNGEQLGAPYIIAGGQFTRGGWKAYSYEGYLDEPPTWSLVFQVRAGGTHRVFRHAAYGLARRAAGTFNLGGARGFTLEATHAYSPQREERHADAADRFSPWSFRHDELEYLLYGRLSYDPSTPEAVFRDVLRQRTGTDALWEPLQAAGDIVPLIQFAHTCGPDHRDSAPDLEWGGPVASWAAPATTAHVPGGCATSYQGPFDTFVMASPEEVARDVVLGLPTARITPLDVARRVLDGAARARVTVPGGNAEALDVARECNALADLGEYFGHKLRAASALAVYAATARPDHVDAARVETTLSVDAWRALARDTAYLAPFEERLRMSSLGLSPFHWRKVLPLLDGDASSIDGMEQEVAGRPVLDAPPAWAWLDATRTRGPGLLQLGVTPADRRAARWTVTVVLRAPVGPGAAVRVLWKPLSALEDWRTVEARGGDMVFEAVVQGGGHGGMFAVEVVDDGRGWRYPDALEETPYVVLE